ncbi:hypothetical protein MOQ_009130 [Trypanosoma cruzi marinkellei]|uniref:Uncharacterized protein n=1 Tax=Trypanosoma cruzi marinkellei TaxID=85056 RepID=K2LX28_TRYCR|nr:hypothetical protein MOQ_009130 [Trypanosoma cruzi marinkellei]
MASCLGRPMERVLFARIRDNIESRLTPQRSGFWPGNPSLGKLPHLRAAMRHGAPQRRTAAEFVGHTNALETADHDKVILKIRRLSIPNHIVRSPAEFLNDANAVVRIDKPTSSPNTSARGAPQETALGLIIRNIATNSLFSCTSNVPPIRHGILADDPALSHSAESEARSTRSQKEGPSAVAERTIKYFMKANAGKTGRAPLGTANAAPPRLAHEGAPAILERISTFLGVNFRNSRRMGKRVARHREESKQRLLQLTTTGFIAWGPKRDTLRAFQLAPPQVETMRGVRVWCWGASPTARSTLDTAQYGRKNCCSNPERR